MLSNIPLILLAILCFVAFVTPAFGSSGARRESTHSFRDAVDILPAKAGSLSGHPLAGKIRSFLYRQSLASAFQGSTLTGKDYLKVINGQVSFFRHCQDDSGAIIDPVEKIEWQYSTPCYALSAAVLAASGYSKDPEVLQSGIKAMQQSVDEMHEYRTAHNHGEFFIQPVMLALDLFRTRAPAAQVKEWERKLSELDPYKLYPDNLRRKQKCYNHNVVALAGEYLRIKGGLKADRSFLETHLKHHEQYMNTLGMYQDNPGLPMVYDEFSRQYLASILCEGYDGPCRGFYVDRLWRGAWTSLFMQSSFGECPTGGRSAQHIWNEAQCAVTYEIYAAQYAMRGKAAEAGAFKRAAHLALGSIKSWLKPNGTGYVVKNRYPIEARHGYERYSAQSQYNLLACWLMAVAYLYADESVVERPCPADIGGFVVPIIDDFHKVFANAGGTYIEYETSHDVRYNPTGLIRCHVKGSNPQLGPSDGIVHKFDSKTKEDLGGENMAVGPAWQDATGNWHRLADYSLEKPASVDILEETPGRVRFRVVFSGDMDGVTQVSETITVEPDGVTVEDTLEGAGVQNMRVYYPMLVFDGLEETEVAMGSDSVVLSLRGDSIKFSILEPKTVQPKRSGVRLSHRNGEAEAACADINGLHAVYRIGHR